MVRIHDGLVEIHTRDTSYILSTAQGTLENLYYGGRIQVADPNVLLNKDTSGYGTETKYNRDKKAMSSLLLDMSGAQRGEVRRPALQARMPHGGYTSEYTFTTAVLQQDGHAPTGEMPHGRGADEVLRISMTDPTGILVDLYYSVFAEANVITRRMRVTNQSAGTMELVRALSYQLDFPHSDFTLYTLTGAWSRECNLTPRPLAPGTLRFGVQQGHSSAYCNPFFFLAENGATEHTGGVYGFNLVYSGSHEGSVEVDHLGRTRVMAGINSEGFAWPLAPGEQFVTPEAVLTYSDGGKNGMSHNMHHFVRHHILPPRWKDAERPVLCNNWEGTYFDFNEAKLLGMAKAAAKAGIELFVLDDGWFGARNSDTAGLGDYNVNHKKLPGGLSGLAQKINKLGMDFGLWFEPEMTNADSDLFRAHPDWIVKTPGYEPAEGRNQYVLDLTREKVREYIIRSMNAVLDSAAISHVKWDMNRNLSDNWSLGLEGRQGEFTHRYTLGLYKLFDGIIATHPDILFEGCASGGNRFDLGILYYCPQIWTSDCTDAVQRQKIQAGASYGYPLCTMGCHVSAVPNHQTLRKTPRETRFNTAMFGLLGYELDLTRISERHRRDIAAQVEYYKKHRRLLQYGDFYRLQSLFESDTCRWMVVSPDKTEAMVGDYTGLVVSNATVPPMRLAGLDEDILYDIQVRRQKIRIETFGGLVNHVLPVNLNPEGSLLKAADKLYRLSTENEHYTAYGSLLHKAGINRIQPFSGSGYSQDFRVMNDFASRVYYLQQVKVGE